MSRSFTSWPTGSGHPLFLHHVRRWPDRRGEPRKPGGRGTLGRAWPLETFLGEIRSNRPLFIIDASRPNRSGIYAARVNRFGFDLFKLVEFPPTAAILNELYTPVPEFSDATGDYGYRVYRRRDPPP